MQKAAVEEYDQRDNRKNPLDDLCVSVGYSICCTLRFVESRGKDEVCDIILTVPFPCKSYAISLSFFYFVYNYNRKSIIKMVESLERKGL